MIGVRANKPNTMIAYMPQRTKFFAKILKPWMNA